MSSEVFGTSNAIDAPSCELTIKHINKTIEKLSRIKRPIIAFSRWVDAIYKGDTINELLKCSAFEEGYLVPESLRDQLEREMKLKGFGTIEIRDIKEIWRVKTDQEIRQMLKRQSFLINGFQS